MPVRFMSVSISVAMGFLRPFFLGLMHTNDPATREVTTLTITKSLAYIYIDMAVSS